MTMNPTIKHEQPDQAVSPETAALIDEGHTIQTNDNAVTVITEDKRKTARHEHTNHFTNRASQKKN